MRIAYIDHSYHQKTKSTTFFPEILSTVGEVGCFWDTSWNTGRVERQLLSKIAEFQPDLVVFFQIIWPAKLLESLGIRGGVMIPMYDADCHRKAEEWKSFANYTFVSFSRALTRDLTSAVPRIVDVQYYPADTDVIKRGASLKTGKLTGFYWHRSDQVGWETVSTLMNETEWGEFYVHDTPDPGSSSVVEASSWSDEAGVTHGSWFRDRSEFTDRLANADVFFVPRRLEGIGMGFLEAMREGCCVVAPDLPTHNEYIIHGVNGILYDPDAPKPVDLSNARALGRRAAIDVRHGNGRWEEDKSKIVTLLSESDGKVDSYQMNEFLSSVSERSGRLRVRPSLFHRVWRRLIAISG